MSFVTFCCKEGSSKPKNPVCIKLPVHVNVSKNTLKKRTFLAGICICIWNYTQVYYEKKIKETNKSKVNKKPSFLV